MAAMNVDMIGAVVGDAVKPRTKKVGRHGRDVDQATLKRLSLAIDPGLHRQLKQAALDNNTTIVELVVDAIDQYLAHREVKQ